MASGQRLPTGRPGAPCGCRRPTSPDVTASVYTYLINGHATEDNWTAIFNSGERIRLRIINASAMTIFNFRIPDCR